MNELTLIIETITVTVAFICLAWALICHCKKDKPVAVEENKNSNVVSIHSGNQLKLKRNLQLFLDAENALSRNENEKYMAIMMQALDNARRNLEQDKQREKRAG